MKRSDLVPDLRDVPYFTEQDSHESVAAHSALISERAVLSIALSHPNKLADIVSRLSTKDWYQPNHRTIFNALCALHKESKQVDLPMLSQWLLSNQQMDVAGGHSYVGELSLEFYVSDSLDWHVHQIINARCLREMRRYQMSLAQSLTSPSASADDLIAASINQLRGLLPQSKSAASTGIADLAQEVFKDIEDRYNNPGQLPGLSTGLPTLDYHTTGLRPGNLVVIAARPGIGKTSLALNMAQHICTQEQSAVVMFSLEMGGKELTERMMATHAGIDNRNLRCGELSKMQWLTLADSMHSFSQMKMEIFGLGSGVSRIVDIESRLAFLEEKKNFKPKALIVENLQLFAPVEKSGNRTQDVGEVSRGLKMLAGALGIPVIALAALNRETVKRKRPILSDLRESGSIESDADIVLLIHRDEETDGEAELIIAKNRHGPLATIDMYFTADKTVFREQSGLTALTKPI